MKTFIGVGIDQYEDDGITPLNGAANDAMQLAAFFKHRLGFQSYAITHSELRAGKTSVLGKICEEMRKLVEGDLLVFFFAGHGKSAQYNGEQDQILLLPNASLTSIENGYFNEGTLSVRQIANIETVKPGVARALIFDACRMPIEKRLAETRDGQQAIAFDGEDVYRDTILRSRPKRWVDAADSPMTVLLSCRNGQRAREVRAERRGLYTLAIEDALAHKLQQERPIVFDASFDESLEQSMNRVASAHGIDRSNQSPVRQGVAVTVYQPQDRHSATLKALQQQFDEQLAAGQLDQPLGANCRDTLVLLVSQGLPPDGQAALRQKLQAALEAQQQQQHSLLNAFDAHLAAGRLNTPYGNCCQHVLERLSMQGLDTAQMDALSQRLQDALAARQLHEDRAHDERLIQTVRSTPNMQTCLLYISSARLHEHDAEVQAIMASLQQQSEATIARAQEAARADRDTIRRNNAQFVNTLPARPTSSAWPRSVPPRRKKRASSATQHYAATPLRRPRYRHGKPA